VVGLAEFLGRECFQPSRPGDMDRSSVVVDADSIAIEMSEITTDAATQI